MMAVAVLVQQYQLQLSPGLVAIWAHSLTDYHSDAHLIYTGTI